MNEKQKIQQLKYNVQRQQQKIEALQNQKQELKRKFIGQSKQWIEVKQNYKTCLSKHESAAKKSMATKFIKQRFYQEGICQKVQKIINEIESITSRNLQGSRNSILKYGQDVVDYKKIIMAEKIQKQKQEEQRLLSQIKSLEDELKFEQNTIVQIGQL